MESDEKWRNGVAGIATDARIGPEWTNCEDSVAVTDGIGLSDTDGDRLSEGVDSGVADAVGDGVPVGSTNSLCDRVGRGAHFEFPGG
jgi:hypothetical protein